MSRIVGMNRGKSPGGWRRGEVWDQRGCGIVELNLECGMWSDS